MRVKNAQYLKWNLSVSNSWGHESSLLFDKYSRTLKTYSNNVLNANSTK